MANRQRFVAKIAMGNYDAVIIGHSQFEKIPISRERQEQLLQDEIRNVSHMINQMKKEKGDNWSIKQMVVFENNLKSRLERLMNESKKDLGEVVSSLEITPEGSGYRMKSRFAKFHNLPELMSMFRLVADIQTADMLKLPVPQLEGDKASIVISERSPYQEQMMDEFVERAEKIRNNEVDAKEDNMLKLTHEAKLMSIDPRLVHENAPIDPESKLNLCIHNVFDIWQETQADRLTQVIFSDSGTPKQGQFNVYDEMKSQLVLRGIPDQEIAFIHDVNTDAAREALFEQVRRGEVRILLGSTSAEVKAVAVGNPMLAEKMEADNEVIRLKLLKTNWHNEQVMLERQLSQHYPQVLTSCAEKLEQYQADWKLVEQHQLHDFSITLDGMVYTERPQAGEVLLLLSKVTELEHQAIKVGQFKDFDIMLSRPGFDHVQLHLRGTATYTVELGDSALGNISRLENLLDKIPSLTPDKKKNRS